MKKLDKRRRIALAVIIFAVIFFAIISNPRSSSQTSVIQPVEGVPSVSEGQVTAKPTIEPTQPLVQNIDPALNTLFKKFPVYIDNFLNNHYVLSGFMPTGKCIHVNSYWHDNCQEGQKCLQINYDSICSKEDQGWGGTYWLEPANNWGDQKGGHNLTGAQRLVFWARGKNGGEVIDSFRVGGVTGADRKFPDSDTISMGPVTLTQEWKEYAIDLKGKDLSYIVGGFSWSANAKSNPSEITFYLDNIYYE